VITDGVASGVPTLPQIAKNFTTPSVAAETASNKGDKYAAVA